MPTMPGYREYGPISMGVPKLRDQVIRVLVVDDDIAVGMMLAMQLPQVEVLEASRITQALALARERSPHAVIVDRKLADGDGLDLIRALRATPATESVPILLITAGHDPAERPEVLGAGADEYLAKPFEPADLERQLRELLDLSPAKLRARRGQGERGRPLRADPEPGQPEQEAPPPARRRWRRST